MKRYSLFLLFTIVSCKDDATPDLASDFVGNYYLTENTQLATIETVWKVSKVNENHIDIAMEENRDYIDNVPDEQTVKTTKNVLVEFQNVLIFNSEYEVNGGKGILTGNALLDGDTLSYEILATENGIAQSAAKRLIKR